MPCIAARMKISFVGHSHHRVTQSSQFFVDLLKEVGEVDTVWDETWCGRERVDVRQIAEAADLIVVWQSVAYVKRLAGLKHPNLVYVPMYDAVKDLRRSFWEPLTQAKILNFSSTLHQRVQQFGCWASAYFQYFPNPEDHRQVDDFASLRGFFWQRQPRPAWEQVRKLLSPQFTSFHLHLAVDPNAPDLAEPAAADQRKWRMQISHWYPDQQELLRRLAASNVYFAPRITEGIGLSFLEAMAMGMAVCAIDSATHNEYIVHDANGFLYPLADPRPPDWSRAMDMGRRARASVEQGHRRWCADRDRLFDFLTRRVSRPANWRYARSSPAGTPRLPERSAGSPMAATQAGRKEGGRRVTQPHRSKHSPAVTIATVVRNAPDQLAATLASVVAQSYCDKEVLVIDGDSGAGMADLLTSYGGAIDYWLSESDQGPYDAMNKAADLAHGHRIIYINAGDSFVDEDALSRFMSGVPENADFVAGHHIYLSPQGTEEIHRCTDFEQTYRKLLAGQTDGAWLSGVPGHQAILTRTALIREHRYDTAYRLAADHEFMYRMRRLGARFYIEPMIVTQYVGGGLSSQNLFACLDEWRTIALRYTEHPQLVEKHFRRLLIDTLRFSRKMGTFAWRSEPARSHPLWTVLAEIEFRVRALLDRTDALYVRVRTRLEQAGCLR